MKYVLPVVLLLFFFTGFVVWKTLQVPAEPVHYHANFAVFVDGQQVDFSRPELMHIAPCSDDSHMDTDPIENVHLHDGVGNVVHLHMAGITWKTFFDSIKFEYLPLTNGRELTVYRNGEKVSPGLLSDSPIGKQDRILVHIATQSGTATVSESSLISAEYEKVGSNSAEYDTGKIGIEKCGSEGMLSLWQRARIAFGL